MCDNKPSPTLLALTATALSLPGISGNTHAAGGKGPVDRPTLSYQTSYYKEADADNVSAGSSERYEITTNQFELVFPLDEQAQINVDVLHEKMSGASPWFIEPDANNQPVQVMTGATIEDQRLDATLTLNLFRERSTVALSAGVSDEDDYRAFNGALEVESELENNLWSVTGGVGFSADQVEPTEGGSTRFTPVRIVRDDKRSVTLFGGVSRVLTGDSVAQTGFSVSQSNGFLSDPYKLVRVGGVPIADSRPDKRTQFAWTTRYRRFIDDKKAALHIDYRFFTDSWKITSHTLNLAWHQNLKDRWQVIPSLRYYTQSEAEFYAPFFTNPRADGRHSSDYRLSPYGAVSLRVDANKQVGRWGFSFGLQHYLSNGDNPGLVDFTVANFNVNTNF